MGSAVIAIGPETLLAVLPISLDAKDQTCSNVWLIPILKDYTTGSSAESFQEGCQNKSPVSSMRLLKTNH